MKHKRLTALLLACSLLTASLSGCGSANTDAGSGDTDAAASTTNTSSALSALDNTKWNYNEEDGVYWQVGLTYCDNPADTTYETLGVFVPAAYMDAEDNGDGTYTCMLNTEATVGSYTAETAPIVMPVETPGYSEMEAPTDYVSEAATYTSAGFVYVKAGCRGRTQGAPLGVTDLKAAVRYLRSLGEQLPGSTDRIFTFGMSGGGAQSALMGATGDSELYEPYLEAIGAVMTESDAVAGSMCWCPITGLDVADAAYEWNLGSTRSDLDDETQALSDGLAEAYAAYVNSAGFTDADGNALTLEESDTGIYQSGTYYEYLKSVIEQSLNNFLADTTFPYTQSSGDDEMEFDGELPDGELPDGEKPDGDLPDGEKPDGELPDGELPDGEKPDTSTDADSTSNTGGGYVQDGELVQDGVLRQNSDSTEDTAATYETAQDYIDALNADGEWITYDAATNTATITSVADFAAHCKTAEKSVGAFDDLNEEQAENTLFGYGDGEGAHFDSTMASLLTGTDYESAYTEDLAKTDALGTDVQTRVNMYTPLYYLLDSSEGSGTSIAAKYWRIRTGIEQGDTALTTEVNLALALESLDNTEVDFETVWAQAHTEAERTGRSSENFISWVNSCLAE